jgi:hypothetical protein
VARCGIEWNREHYRRQGQAAAGNKGRNPMNRFGVLSLCAVTGLGLALLSGTAFGQQKTLLIR